MGCDIHMYAEIKHNDKYKSLDIKGKTRYDNKDEIIPIYDNRNYQLFSILAGVRNYNDIVPISEPKGMPEDCCSEIKKEYEYWDCDAHSTSYLTLKELQNYIKKYKTLKYSGYVENDEVELTKQGKFPSSWCRDYSPKDGRLTWCEWEVKINLLKPIINKLRERIKDLCYVYTNKDIRKIEEDIRIVFWFDN